MPLQRRVPLLFAVFALAAALHAGPVESAIVAAMKITEAPNYTWSATVVDDARSYTIDGQTERKSDFSLVTMPLVAALRRRAVAGSAASDNIVTAVFKGDERLVVQALDDTWQTPEELRASGRGAGRRGGGPGGGFPGGRRGGARGGRGGRGAGELPPYSNLQLGLSRPHDEIGIIIANCDQPKIEGDTLTGTLSETGARLLLVHAGQNEINPTHASGRFQLWLKDGVIVKYELLLEGTLVITTSDTRREVAVHQHATTILSAIGTTKFEVPDEAKKKLGG